MVSHTFGNTRSPLEDYPAHAIPELLRPRYTVYLQTLTTRLSPLRACWLAWGVAQYLTSPTPPIVSLLFHHLYQQHQQQQHFPLGATSYPWDWGARTLLALALAGSAAFTLLRGSAREWGGWVSGREGAWLWPPGQCGEEVGQTPPPQ